MPIRVVTLNVWALPFGLSRFNTKRLKLIGERLNQLDADVCAFQEAWTSQARKELISAGKRAGYDFSWHRKSIRNGSGLLLLSRWPIVATQFHPFTLSGLAQNLHHGDWWSGKGIAVHQLRHPEGEFVILNTHLLARYTPIQRADPYFAMRVAEVIEVASVLTGINQPVLALGDFNIQESTDEYEILMGLSGLTDMAADFNQRQNTRMVNNPMRKPNARKRSDARLDYIFKRGNRQADFVTRDVRRVFDDVVVHDGQQITPSDHSGVLAEVDLVPGINLLHQPSRASAEHAQAWLDAGIRLARNRQDNERRLAMVSGGAAALLALATRNTAVTRRRFLRSTLTTAAAVCAIGSGLLASSAFHFVAEEIAGFAQVQRKLDKLLT
jgi:endonuclease/exonuclease/phosphatase family metal-dependent hydrolase